MVIDSLAMSDFRNYKLQEINFDRGINILYGDNAQGKTNILEAIYLCVTNRSYRQSRDREMIMFGSEESHLRLDAHRREVPCRIDLHLKKNKTKGIAINGVPIRKSSELIGLLNVVFFSPEDLQVIKNGPGERRRFIDSELCQLDKVYMYNLSNYNKCLLQRNALLKDIGFVSGAEETLDVWDGQLIDYGRKVINMREKFVREIAPLVRAIHSSLTGGREELDIYYEPNVQAADFSERLDKVRDRELKQKTTLVGPHRDDVRFIVRECKQGEEGTDIRIYGSQGQQRTAALSLKMAEIEIVRKRISDSPILLLDDVLSELDNSRQNYLLDSINNTQTFITCTGLEEFVKHRFHMDKVYHVESGSVKEVNGHLPSTS